MRADFSSDCFAVALVTVKAPRAKLSNRPRVALSRRSLTRARRAAVRPQDRPGLAARCEIVEAPRCIGMLGPERLLAQTYCTAAPRPSDDPPGGLLDSENEFSPLLQKLGSKPFLEPKSLSENISEDYKVMLASSTTLAAL